jgi:hypothetical protein
VRVLGNGRLDRHFGRNGIFSAPRLTIEQLIGEPDGGVTFAGIGAVDQSGIGTLTIGRVSGRGRLEDSFGQAGIATPMKATILWDFVREPSGELAARGSGASGTGATVPSRSSGRWLVILVVVGLGNVLLHSLGFGRSGDVASSVIAARLTLTDPCTSGGSFVTTAVTTSSS